MDAMPVETQRREGELEERKRGERGEGMRGLRVIHTASISWLGLNETATYNLASTGAAAERRGDRATLSSSDPRPLIDYLCHGHGEFTHGQTTLKTTLQIEWYLKNIWRGIDEPYRNNNFQSNISQILVCHEDIFDVPDHVLCVLEVTGFATY